MEIRYDRDLRHNYMVLCGLETSDDYRIRMLAENCPEGLLRCSLRNINGSGYLYYEIDSKQTLRNRYSGGCLGEKDLTGLLLAMKHLSATLEDYLLDIDHILFSADCIYTDIRSGEFYFSYCPFMADDPADGFSGFTEDLISLLDTNDEKAAAAAYMLCEAASNKGMMIADMVSLALEGLGENGGQSDAPPAADIPHDTPAPPEPEIKKEPLSPRIGDDPFPDEDSGKKAKKSSPIGPLIMMLLFAAVFGVNIYIRKRFWLNPEENILSVATAGVSIFMSVLSLIMLVRSIHSGSTSDDALEIDDITGDLRLPLPAKKGRNGNGGPDPAGAWVSAGIEDASLYGAHPPVPDRTPAAFDLIRKMNTDAEKADDDDEETTVLTEMPSLSVSKLYGRNGDITVNIPLDHLPFTVGKLSGCADFVIRDPSVSRMHARFFGDGSGPATQMKDLNSTNGTFLNGRRLKPNETVSIRPGDEIGMGRLVFEFR